MRSSNLNFAGHKSGLWPDIKWYWWEIVMIAAGALIGSAFGECAIGIAAGLSVSSAVSTYVDRKNPKSPTVLRIVGTVFGIVGLAFLVRLSLVFPT